MNFKKRFVLSLILLMFVSSAYARVVVSVMWDSSAAQGVYRSDGVTLLPADSTIQLIWSPDNAASPLDPGNPLVPTGGEVALLTTSTGNSGYWLLGTFTFDGDSYGVGADGLVGGHIYQRVFDVQNGTTPTAGDAYSDGMVAGPLVDQDPTPSVPALSIFWDSHGTTPFIMGQVAPDTVFAVNGSPSEHGTPIPYGYGDNAVVSGAIITETVASPVSGVSGVRYVCAGWTGAGSTPSLGYGTTAAFTLTQDSSLTWNWNTEYYFDVSINGNGSVGSSDAWLSSGYTFSLTATPDADNHFVVWTGDVPEGHETDNPLALTMDQPRSLTAVFAEDNPGAVPDLLLYYSFDQDSGAAVIDDSGNGNDGIVVGPDWNANGIIGGAYEFDGVDDYIQTSKSTPLPTGLDDFTVTAWARPDCLLDTEEAHEGDARVLIANQFEVNDFQLCVQKPGWIGMWTGVPQSAGNYSPTQEWTLGDWYHFAATRQSGTVSIYRNGQLIHQAPDVGNRSIEGSVIDIGFRTSTGSHPWDGAIDELRIYGKALSGSEITELYEEILPENYTLTVAGSPAEIGAPSPDAYGDHEKVDGSALTETIASPVAGTAGVRYVCSGWTGSGDVPATGTGTSVSFTQTQDSALTWTWVTEYAFDGDALANGSVDTADQWVAANAQLDLTATADADYHFVKWTGDVVAGSESNNPLSVTMDQTRTITAVFAPDSAGTADDPILYYSFDVDNGATVTDDSGNGNPGNVSGAAWSASGMIGGAYEFDGIDDFIRTSKDNPLPRGMEDFSMSVWARPDMLLDTPEAHEGDSRVLIVNQFAVNDFQLLVQKPGWIGVWTGQPSTAGNYSPTVSWTLGEWYHFVATRESGTIKIYRDTELLHSAADVGSTSIQGSLLDIGFRTSTGSHPWDGAIDEVRIYGRAISETEIEALYEAAVGEQCELTVSGSPANLGTSTPNGYGISSVTKDSAVTESVTSPVAGPTGTRYVCNGWTGTGSVSPAGFGRGTTFTITEDSDLSWNWATEYLFGGSVSGSGSISVSDAWIESGAELVVTATPNAGNHFVSWTGDVPAGSESNNPFTVTMDMARTITANFAADPVAPQDDPVLYYSFDVDDPAAVADDSGNGNTGNVFGAAWAADGKIGGAYNFDGIDDYINANVVASELGLADASPRTVTLWCKPDVIPTADYVFCMGSKVSMYDLFGVKLRDDTLEFDIDLHSDGRWGGQFTNATWYMVAVVYDGTNLSLYLDGAEVPLHDSPTGPNGPLTLSTTDGFTLKIGSYCDPIAAFFNGMIDEFRVYNRALTSNEVAVLTQQGDGPSREIYEYNGHTYEFVGEEVTWSNAKVAAEAKGGHLVKVDDRAENDFIVSHLPSGFNCIWLGGNDVAVEDTWRWHDGSLLSDGFEFWGMNNPDDASGGQDELVIRLDDPTNYAGGKWDDVNELIVPSPNNPAYVIEYDGATPADGPVLYYSFDADGGATVSDESGSGHHGAFSNASWTSAGVSGGGARVPADGLVKAPTSLTVDMTSSSAYTFSLWWKLDDDSIVTPVFFSKRFAGGEDPGLNLALDGFSYYRVHTRLHHWQRYAVTTSVAGWHHSVFVKDGNSWTVYHDGQGMTAGASMGWPESVDVTQNLLPLLIGGDHINGHTFNGTIDEVKIFDRTLSSTEVGELYGAPQQISYTLAVAGNPQAIGTSTPNGYGSHSIQEGTSVTESVTSPFDGADGTRYVCQGWTGTGSVPATGAGTSVTLTVAMDSTITWNWLPQYYLDPDVEFGGSLDVFGGWYYDGVRVLITATETAGYRFPGWTGDTNGCTIVGQQIDVPMTSAREITAGFTVDMLSLVVTSAHGAPTPVAGSHTYVSGSAVTCTVAEVQVTSGLERYTCTGWIGTGNVPTTGNTTSFSVALRDQSSSVTWQWMTEYYLELSSTSGGQVNGDSRWYSDGVDILLAATPAEGFRFIEWQGDVPLADATANPLVLTMDQGRQIEAVFSSKYSPDHDQVITNKRPQFTWLPVDAATWYQVWVDRDGREYHSMWLEQTDTAYAPDFDFSSGSFRWWVQGWSTSNDLSAWAGPFTFSVPILRPDSSVITSIPPGSEVATNRPQLSWTPQDDDGEPLDAPDWYHFYMSKNGKRHLQKWIEGQTNCVLDTELGWGDYEWWVRGWNDDGYGPWSEGCPFTYGEPQTAGPTGTVTETRKPGLRWGQVDQATWYYLYMEKDGKEHTKKWIKNDTNYVSDAELSGGTYKWWVKSHKNGGGGLWSEKNEFKIPKVLPGEIAQITPLADTPAGIGMINYSWMTASNASWHQVWITKDGVPWFGEWFDTSADGARSTRTIGGHSAGSLYAWWMRAWNEDGYGPWTAGASFDAQ